MSKANPPPEVLSQPLKKFSKVSKQVAANSKQALSLALHSSSPKDHDTEISKLCDDSLVMLAVLDNLFLLESEPSKNFLGTIIKLLFPRSGRRLSKLVRAMGLMWSRSIIIKRLAVLLNQVTHIEQIRKVATLLSAGIWSGTRDREVARQNLFHAEINLGCLEEMAGSEGWPSLRLAREQLLQKRTFPNLSATEHPPKLLQIISEVTSEPSFLFDSRGSQENEKAPNTHQKDSQSISRQMDCEWKVLRHVTFRSSGILEDGHNAYFFDSGLLPDNYWYAGRDLYWKTGEVLGASLLTIDTKTPEKRLPHGIVLPSRAPGNWFHWWFEVMHAVLLESPDIPVSAPVVIRSQPPKKFVDIFSKFSERPLLVLGRDLPSEVYLETAWTLPPALHTRDSFSPRHINSVPFFDQNALEKIRNSVLRSIEPDNGPKKVFFMRQSGHRNLENQREVVRLSKKAGFSIVDPASLSLDQQVALIRGADATVSAGGAVMTNYLFARAGSTIVQLVSEQNADFSAPEVLCQVSGAHLRTVEGKSHSVESFPNALWWQHSNFKLNVRSYESILSSL